jgi:hypothetical protein
MILEKLCCLSPNLHIPQPSHSDESTTEPTSCFLCSSFFSSAFPGFSSSLANEDQSIHGYEKEVSINFVGNEIKSFQKDNAILSLSDNKRETIMRHTFFLSFCD